MRAVWCFDEGRYSSRSHACARRRRSGRSSALFVLYFWTTKWRMMMKVLTTKDALSSNRKGRGTVIPSFSLTRLWWTDFLLYAHHDYWTKLCATAALDKNQLAFSKKWIVTYKKQRNAGIIAQQITLNVYDNGRWILSMLTDSCSTAAKLPYQHTWLSSTSLPLLERAEFFLITHEWATTRPFACFLAHCNTSIKLSGMHWLSSTFRPAPNMLMRMAWIGVVFCRLEYRMNAYRYFSARIS